MCSGGFSIKAYATHNHNYLDNFHDIDTGRQEDTLFYARRYALAADHSAVDTEDGKLLILVGANDKSTDATKSGEASGRFVAIQTGNLVCNMKELNVSRNGKSLTLIFK